MKLVIAEYLRTLRERDELDRLLPDLLLEMGYVLVARPQTGNRQFGVDLSARGKDPKDGEDELLLLVVKQGDIGRSEFDSVPQGVRSSINEIFDVYLRSHLAPQDENRRVRIVVATNGELKQTVLASWSGFLAEKQGKPVIEFWGIDRLAELVERYLFDEHVFRDEDRKQLRRALALSGDSEYDQRDLHRLFTRTLGLHPDGSVLAGEKSPKQLMKALSLVNLSAQVFAAWSITEGDARQALRASERALLWAWHRIQLADEATKIAAVDALLALLGSYLNVSSRYFQKLQPHCMLPDGWVENHTNGCEFSLVVFEQIGILASIGLATLLMPAQDKVALAQTAQAARQIAQTLLSAIKHNGICSSPCLDRHSQDITLALMLLQGTALLDEAKEWVQHLVRNIDYAYKAGKYVPVATDSLDDLVESGGWCGESAKPKAMNMSWTLPTLAGWCVIFGLDDSYRILVAESKANYPEVCMQLWHPDADLYQHLYFATAHFDCGASEAPINLPDEPSDWRKHMALIVAADKAGLGSSSIAAQAGLAVLDVVVCRHFQTPVPPSLWYRFAVAD